MIERHPCSIRLLPVPISAAQFHDFDVHDRLVQAADRLDLDTYLIVLLGGDAGLRLGEMMALEREDVDLQKRQLCVQNSDWKGHVTTTKGGRLRHVPITERLAAALKAHRHLRGKRELVQANGEPLMHLSPAAIEGAIRLLDASRTGTPFGNRFYRDR